MNQLDRDGVAGLLLHSSNSPVRYWPSVATFDWSQMRKNMIRSVAILAGSGDDQSHDALLPQGGFLELRAPIGRIRLDERSISFLQAYPNFSTSPTFVEQHADILEGPLSFSKICWPRIPVIPICIGSATSKHIVEIGLALRNLLYEGTFLLGVSHPVPDSSTAGPTTDFLSDIDPSAGRKEFSPKSDLVSAAISLALGNAIDLRAFNAENILDLGSSCKALCIKGRFPAIPQLSDPDKATLRQLVRDGIDSAISKCRSESGSKLLEALSPRLSRPGSAFVTITEGGNLRGCMGRLNSKSLGHAVYSAAKLAINDDPRFEPISASELKHVEIEISILGEFEEIASSDDFEPGRHGLLLTHGCNRGLLLPQVATEHSLNRDQFLEALSEKAGLPRLGWKEAKLERFGIEAVHF